MPLQGRYSARGCCDGDRRYRANVEEVANDERHAGNGLGMGLIWIVVVILLVLGIVALVKYISSGRKH